MGFLAEKLMKFKPLIFCLVGDSGSGKTMIAEALEKYAGIPLIQSYTDRPRRTPTENGHTFLEKADFDLLKREDMVAYTQWGEYRYCCLHADIPDVSTYVIDESGLKMLKADHADKYHIVSIRVCRNIEDRVSSVGMDRVERDAGKFTLPFDYFDYLAYNQTNEKLDVICEVWQIVRKQLEERRYDTTGIEVADLKE
jgi:guanylate kinase